MAGLIGKIASLARTPAGQRALRTATTKAQEVAKDPRTKERVAEVKDRIQRRGRGTSGSEQPSTPAPHDRADRHDDRPHRS